MRILRVHSAVVTKVLLGPKEAYKYMNLVRERPCTGAFAKIANCAQMVALRYWDAVDIYARSRSDIQFIILERLEIDEMLKLKPFIRMTGAVMPIQIEDAKYAKEQWSTFDIYTHMLILDGARELQYRRIYATISDVQRELRYNGYRIANVSECPHDSKSKSIVLLQLGNHTGQIHKEKEIPWVRSKCCQECIEDAWGTYAANNVAKFDNALQTSTIRAPLRPNVEMASLYLTSSKTRSKYVKIFRGAE